MTLRQSLFSLILFVRPFHTAFSPFAPIFQELFVLPNFLSLATLLQKEHQLLRSSFLH